ncbi:hypothetical protein [Roseomonas populi]|uniref:Uncharacterized protein n=1 Tax=Roseomonas populi TaxID=3121582 RepID=A0ABT1XAG9_9PROT|nr:hypothetical protein [Roseomonas pecuniae]MCR0983974.1 hypothetical protein [Roseomonas pecuniae]
MNRSLRLLVAVAALIGALPSPGASAQTSSRLGNAPVQTERSADEAMYDARYGIGPRNDAGQGSLERNGATGGGGQHG